MNSHSIEQFGLDNGLQIVLENIPYRNSASVGIWVPVGSRCESKSEMGYSHFTEHMLFKGTQKRDYRQISLDIDRLGGYMNASTSKEITNYYITLSPRFIETALDVLSDIFFNSTLPANEFHVEKKVILEEIKMGQDNPDDYLFDIFYGDIFGNAPLGRPIPGTAESISSSTREELHSYYKKNYGTSDSVISLAGSLWNSESERSKLKSQIHSFFDRTLSPNSRSCLQTTQKDVPCQKRLVHHKYKKLEQVHFALGLPGLPETEKKDAYLQIFTHLMGGTMSSRLFRKLREENGLCYSVGTFHYQYYHEGLWGVYCGTSQQSFLESVKLMMELLEESIEKGIPERETEEAKTGLSGSIELAMELPIRRANYNAKSLLYYGTLRDWKENIQEIESTTAQEMIDKIRSLWSNKEYILTSLGKLDSDKMKQEIEKTHPPILFNESRLQ